MFASERDLLAIEPHAFTDALWAGRRVTGGQGDVSGTTLTAASASVGFDAAQVAAGQVVVVAGVPLEVVSVVSATQLAVSLLRADASGPALPPAPVAGVGFTVVSFAPQIALVHRQLLGLLGLEGVDGPGADAIVDTGALAHAEALGALHLIYSAASALSGPSSALGARAAQYRELFSAARRGLAVRLDLDGDGVADATRRPSLVHLVRG